MNERLGDFYRLVPKDPAGNLDFRSHVLRAAAASEADARSLRTMCSEDLFFFLNAFAWLLEPRNTAGGKVIPFITRKYQDELFYRPVLREFGRRDVVIDKSREMGATWMALYLFLQAWLFEDWITLGLVSRNEDAVDKRNDPDALMPKLDFALEYLPVWMKPAEIDRSKAQLTNPDNGSTIMGYPATGDVARGGRKFAFILEEFHSFNKGEDYAALASTQHVTNCRLFISTIKGPSGAYYDVLEDAKKENSNSILVTLDWTDDPEKATGLYTADKEGKLELLDRQYRFPDKYPFILDGRKRSPYYDRQWRRPGNTPQRIAQELDRDAGASGYSFFDQGTMTRIRERDCRAPYQQGSVFYDPTEEKFHPRFVKQDNGPVKLWCPLDVWGNPPAGTYLIGCDIAAGTGGSHSSNSAIEVIGRQTGEQMLELASNTISPVILANLAVSICYWFGEAMLIWEANGPTGAQFTKEIERIGYGNVFIRESKDLPFVQKKKSVGFWQDDETRPQLCAEMLRAMDGAELIVRSAKVFDETRQYVYLNGVLTNSDAATTQDQSAKGKAHGDRVIAVALAWHLRRDVPKPEVDVPHVIPIGSMAWRLAEMEKHETVAAGEAEPGWH